MEKLVSNWFGTVQSLPEDYVFPPDKRPGEVIAPQCNSIPVIDLSKAGPDHESRSCTIRQIMNASQEFGFFQVTNHGVSENLIDETVRVVKEFFDMPAEDKASVYSEDPFKPCSLYTSSYRYKVEKVHFWRDLLRQPCHPLDQNIHLWPEKPNRYRDIVGTYSIEVRSLSLRILELICEGLGLEAGYFGNELTEVQDMIINHYPPCPYPSLTLGLPKHCDPNLITILLQGDVDVHGLQVFKDGQWIAVEPLPNAFVVNIGYQLQILSNGKFKSAEHRAVTNSKNPRTTIVTFFNPSFSSIIEPAKALVDECNPPLYKSFEYKEFLNTYWADHGDTEIVLEPFKIKA